MPHARARRLRRAHGGALRTRGRAGCAARAHPPVCPYAITVPLKPLSTSSTTRSTPDVYTSCCVASGGST